MKDETVAELFARIDVHQSGRVDLATLREAFRGSEHPLKHSPDGIATLFRELDRNHDGVVTFDEFREYVEQAEAQIQRGFERLDKDRDGRLAAADLERYLRGLQARQAASGSGSGSPGASGSGIPSGIPSGATSRTGPTPGEFTQLIHNKKRYITYEEWRDLLVFVPRLNGSRLMTAYQFISGNDVDLSSEGDVTVLNDLVKGFGYFAAGGLSGVVSRTCTAPFDRIKVFLIARTDLSSTILKAHELQQLRAQHKLRSPLIKAATTLYRQGGLKAFYVGNGLNVLKVFPESAMKFGSFEAAKRFLQRLEGTDELSRMATYLAGGVGGVVSQFTVYPIDTLKYRVQCANLDSKERGTGLLLKTAREMYREGGLRIFYRGVFVGVTGIFPYAACDLGTFSALKKWYISKKAAELGCSKDDVVLSNLIVLPMGAFSGTVGATLVYPINLLRTRLQAQGTYAHPYKYSGFRDVLLQTVQREGYPGLFKGLVPNLAKVCPAVSISYLMYENLKRMMNLD